VEVIFVDDQSLLEEKVYSQGQEIIGMKGERKGDKIGQEKQVC